MVKPARASSVQRSGRSAFHAFADSIALAMVFLSFLAAHWIAQAIAWANDSRGLDWHLLFGILGLPLVHLAGSRTDQFFLLLSVPNSIIWAAGLTFLTSRYRSRREGARAIR